MKPKKRIIIFIDGSNLYHITKKVNRELGKSFLFDIERFIEYLAGEEELIKTFYYTAPLNRKKDLETYSKQQKFFSKIRKIPNFELVLCRMQKEKIDGKTIYLVKEDDIHLAVDMVNLAHKNSYEGAILVSSDGDFVPAIKIVQEVGKRVINVGFENKFSWHLKQKCDRFLKLKNKEILQFFRKK